MKRLKVHFSKNGLDYTLIKRNEKIALFCLEPELYPDRYEVCRIYVVCLRSMHSALQHKESNPNTYLPG